MAKVEIEFNEKQVREISDWVASIMKETVERYEAGEDNDILAIFQKVRNEREEEPNV